jgi:hypothetical protein
VYVSLPPLATAVIEDVHAFATADNVLADIPVLNTIIIFPKNADIYFILFKAKINVTKVV